MNIEPSEKIYRSLKMARRLRHFAATIWAALLTYAFLFVDGPFLGMAGVLTSVSFIWGIVALASGSLAILHFGVNGGIPKSIRKRRYEASLVLVPRDKGPANMKFRLNPFSLPLLTQGMILVIPIMAILPVEIRLPLIIPAFPLLAWICADVREVMWLDQRAFRNIQNAR